ncbi:phage resistance protein [Nocardia iowensis]|uniref:Phage resistance protein n=1 Tax=Nocardia iowensis TaxID=204891 RepID=A0ABX8RU40_NOCIO|nr:phage resistance protein [Nocardia iowensis]QXN93149.1 phage resistance protein [Nocardia iowensis]
MSTFLRDVIDIPARAGTDDYVLKLTEGTSAEHLRQTLAEYVLTDSLRQNFEQALGLIADAIGQRQSRAAFLNGSFGSGKSHFMAVLYALLGNAPVLRDDPELRTTFTPLVGMYDDLLPGRKILRLTYHMVGTDSLEEMLFRKYVEQIQRLHPDTTLPPLYLSDELLADAEVARATMGDDSFFAMLGGPGNQPTSVWDNVDKQGTWTADSYHRARAAAPESEDRANLVTALVNSMWGSFTSQAQFVDLDKGLRIISEHAKSLGYEAVVLFVDELVLWLTFHVRNHEFFARESQKLSKLVEASSARAIPLISFIPRQHDLRKWLANAGASGAEQEALDRAFHFQEGRFLPIRLGDDNLVEVAHARVLKPKPGMQPVLDQAFRNVTRDPQIWDTLRDSMNTDDEHRGASEAEFAKTYPFSPALVSTLRNLAGVMQRERTALKVMQKMLSDRRNTLTVDDLIPVGDAFDDIVVGNTPLDAGTAAMFRSAVELYRGKLRPYLLQLAGITEEQLLSDPASQQARLFLGRDRLAKTLLLSAIAPKVPALRDITASRLTALNHGSIKSPLPNGEQRIALSAVRDWSRTVAPEIKVREGNDPIIDVTLADVDYKSVLDRIKGEDNAGRRRALIRRLVHRAMGIVSDQDDLTGAATKTVVWRGSRREVDIVFGNVRDAASLNDDAFEARPGTWRFIIDYPFDEHPYSYADDLRRIDRLRNSGGDRDTIVWLPQFFTDRINEELAQLVILDWLFTGSGDRWRTNSDNLSETERAQARGILENLRHGSQNRIEQMLRMAYGLDPADPRFVTPVGDGELLLSLTRDFQPKDPVAVTMGDALDRMIDQAFAASHPAHPEFVPADEEIRPPILELVRTAVAEAVADPHGRVVIEAGPARKAVQKIADKLRVGRATGDGVFLFGEQTFAFWATELDRAPARPDAAVTVRELQGRIKSVTPSWGLRDEVRDLIIAAWAMLRRRAWYEAGTAINPPPLGRLREHLELRPQRLPTATAWDRARTLGSELFGYTSARTHLTPDNVAELSQQLRTRATAAESALRAELDQLQAAYARLGIQPDSGDRLTIGQRLLEFLAQLAATGDNVSVIDTAAAADLPIARATLARLLAHGNEDTAALKGFDWPLLNNVSAGTEGFGVRKEEARAILNQLRSVLCATDPDLAARLATVKARIIEWVSTTPADPRPPITPEPTDPTVPPPGPVTSATQNRGAVRKAVAETLTDPETVTLSGADDINSVTTRLHSAYEQADASGKRLRVSWWIE